MPNPCKQCQKPAELHRRPFQHETMFFIRCCGKMVIRSGEDKCIEDWNKTNGADPLQPDSCIICGEIPPILDQPGNTPIFTISCCSLTVHGDSKPRVVENWNKVN